MKKKSYDPTGGCCAVFVVIVIISLSSIIGYSYYKDYQDNEKARQAQELRERTESNEIGKKGENTDMELELRKFAKAFVPDLQQAIDKYNEQIKQFTDQRTAFAQELLKLDVDPNSRAAYERKGEIIENMKQDVAKLLADRKETYIKWKELNLLRDTANTQEQRDLLLQNAQKAAKSADETFKKYIEQSRENDKK
jgi:hypothetical protein